MAFSISRNLELSYVYYIQQQINASWSGVTTVKGFPRDTKAVLPVISVRLLSEVSELREIGSRLLNDEYLIAIDIFATSDGQRLDLSDSIKNLVIQDFTYYEHSRPSGGGETIERTAGGKVVFKRINENNKVDFGETVDVYDRFRHFISVAVKVVET